MDIIRGFVRIQYSPGFATFRQKKQEIVYAYGFGLIREGVIGPAFTYLSLFGNLFTFLDFY